MSTAARRRIIQEMKNMKNNLPPGIYAEPTSSLMHWRACIIGPDETVWEKGTFELSIEFTEEYPKKPPIILFKTPMFHPNSIFYTDGKICLDILQNQWSPMMNIFSVLTSIQSLLPDPNTKSPANPVASKLYEMDRKKYNRITRQYVERSWFSTSYVIPAAFNEMEQ